MTRAECGKGLLLVTMEVEEGFESELNAWYDQEHFPERVTCPGFISGRRFRAVEGGPRYLAYYELESTEVLESEAYQAISPTGKWGARVISHVTELTRTVYEDITPSVPESFRSGAVRA